MPFVGAQSDTKKVGDRFSWQSLSRKERKNFAQFSASYDSGGAVGGRNRTLLLLDWNFIMIVFDAEAWLGRFGPGFVVQRSTLVI